MPSRQERRKAERDAAKRAPVQAGAAGAAAARANVNPLGGWATQAEDPALLYRALGPDTLRQRAREGDREAQFSMGCVLMSGAAGEPLGAGGRSPKADVGLALCTAQFPIAHQTESRGCGYLTTK
jgi:hypothetical protein